ncbi:hypothetical protein K402DRAFT_406879 [Aulographum hederae CBS 113979]|uniref:R3H domain protein n=1 Tax=Aulographum hederae CBS 113979 TaxID=1176131 RepID=A0A6G1GRH3_9PEZI|nr:hypothetical protein K402DRAFT_406879 [Aulographum hederae CBS 113979]
MASQYHGMYHDNSQRSPNSSHRHQQQQQQQQQQTLHRQPSRQFDAYGALPSGLYTAEDHAAQNYIPRYNDRLNATLHSNYGAYDMGGAQAWNTFGGHGQNNNNLAALGATTRMKPSARGRSTLPPTWLDQPPPPLPNMPFSGLGSSALSQMPPRQDQGYSELDEELIPTAIVIKNIPFAVKKEQLVQLMTDMRLPLPYAFNYHFDNGVFRGLAFANFTTADETAVVIEAMNHFDLHGRKLRVEYKKMLPLAERERIEREKRERRGQLEEQHRPMAGSGLQAQPSMSSLSSHIPATSPSPVSARNQKPDYDLNDPEVLRYYSSLLIFKEDLSRDSMTFPSTLTPEQRRTVHTLAHHMALAHVSKGTGEQRQVHIFRVHDNSPPIPQVQNPGEQRRALNRAATTDFSDVRGGDGLYGQLGRQGSGLLGFGPDSPGGLTAGQNLRAAKSYADLRSYTPSPVPSTASFPATLNTNFGRFADYGNFGAASNPSLTPTNTSMTGRDDSLLVNGLNSMNLGGGFGQSGSPRGMRSRFDDPGPIGGHRAFSTNFDEQSRDRGGGMPARQPRGPIPERGTGFSRGRNGHTGRGSDETSSHSGRSNVEIVVE